MNTLIAVAGGALGAFAVLNTRITPIWAYFFGQVVLASILLVIKAVEELS